MRRPTSRRPPHARPLTPALIVAVTVDVDHVSVGGADQEPPDPPRFRRERVHDVEATTYRLLVGLVDAVPDVHGDRRVLGSRRILGDELNGRAAVGGAEARDPAHVEVLDAEP